MPLGAAFFNFIMPLQIGARDGGLPEAERVLLFWTFAVGAVILNLGWFMKDGAPRTRAGSATRRLTTSPVQPHPRDRHVGHGPPASWESPPSRLPR